MPDVVPGVALTDGPRRWSRYVALGDSLSEGLGDPQHDGSVRGWAAVLAGHLREHQGDVAFHNLAVRGYLARHALDRQLQPALALDPDLVSVFIGGNDVLLRPRFLAQRFQDELDALVTPFADQAATVLLSTLPDLTACSPVPHPYRALLRRRLRSANDVIRHVAERHGTVLLDAWSDPRTRRHGMWSIDRIHPSADGHRLIAHSAATLLRLPVDPAEQDLAPARPHEMLRRNAQEAAWLLRHGMSSRSAT